MKTRARMIMVAILVGASLLISACGGGAAPATSSGDGSGVLQLGSDGEGLAFKPNALTASPGQKVTVKFKNNSSAQQHNWILIKGGPDVAQQVATAGLTAGADKGYLVADPATIIANTTLSSAGQTLEVSFTAPDAGTYIFLCTVPGHFPLMQGTLTVK
jgi:azurin